ncbi:MAG: DUF6733 family protein [Pseudomonadota bacterium]
MNSIFKHLSAEAVPSHNHSARRGVFSARTGTAGLALISGVALMLSVQAHAQDGGPISGSVSFNSDAFFGVNPYVGVSYDTGNLDLTFYGIYWGAGTGQDWGNWTEFGIGVGFEALDGDLYVNPQLGFTSGNLLSSGTAEPGVVGDGIVPNLTMNYGTDDWEGQLYFGWYLPLRDEAPDEGTTLEYIHYWLSGGKKLSRYFSIGAHFEELRLSGGSDVDSQDGYQWLGPYFQVGNDKMALRFSFGADLTDDETSFSASDFYKLQFSYNF